MAQRRATRRAPRRAKPKAPKLPVTKRVVTRTERVQFGRYTSPTADVDELLNAAFIQADDGDCNGVSKTLDRAAAAGANVSLHRKQLLQDCKLDRENVAGLKDDALRAWGGQKEWFNWRTALVALGALWIGKKVL